MDINNKDEIELLVKKCQSESPFGTKSFSQLVTLFEPAVFRLCLNYIKNISDAEDLTQNIFLKVFHNIKSFKGESAFKTWLYRIAINQCNDLYNKKKKQQLLTQENIEMQELKPTSISSEEKLELGNQIELSFEKLSPQEREVLILRFYQDLKIQEIADTLGIQLSAAKMRLSRAIEHFKLIYDP